MNHLSKFLSFAFFSFSLVAARAQTVDTIDPALRAQFDRIATAVLKQTGVPAPQPPAAQTPDTQGTAAQQNTQGGYTLSVNANIVLTNVVVRDKKTGALIKDLKASDFQILENGKPQKIASFDYENVDEAAALVVQFAPCPVT